MRKALTFGSGDRSNSSIALRKPALGAVPLQARVALAPVLRPFEPVCLAGGLGLFHSAAHLRWRSRAAIWLAVGSRFEALAFFFERRLFAGSSAAGEACASVIAPSPRAGALWANAGAPRASAKNAAPAMRPLFMKTPLHGPTAEPL
jgi:hypothetical protein